MNESAAFYSVLIQRSSYNISGTFPLSCKLICTCCGTELPSRRGETYVRAAAGLATIVL